MYMIIFFIGPECRTEASDKVEKCSLSVKTRSFCLQPKSESATTLSLFIQLLETSL